MDSNPATMEFIVEWVLLIANWIHEVLLKIKEETGTTKYAG